MDASGSQDANRAYYDAFAARYERGRGESDPGGYHELVDELETEFVERFGRGGAVLEVGCGTGLLLKRIRSFAQRAVGVDLSPRMLDAARARDLEVYEASATALPFPDASFDVTCSFKVLAHIPEIEKVLSEMARVTRPGGVILAEFYNPNSSRGLLKRFGPKRMVSKGPSGAVNEGHVFIRYDSPARARALAPAGCRFETARGVRIVTPSAYFMRIPGVKQALWYLERNLCDSRAAAFAGFFVAAYRKLP